MNTRPATRGLTSRSQNSLVVNENLSRPPLPGRAKEGLLGNLKRKAEGVAEGSKVPKKRSALERSPMT
ncbi:hypothetical protein GWK47_027464 [Chionoecetes opilio]|uniref:Uncharacterized protein n=1 Tax=Chionoecetes opilio TaxID=41210 RepID=A0A8J8WMF8_CHIOP|nr:hypothetical protein GWK47_027464 [Chionoecetes opilio]